MDTQDYKDSIQQRLDHLIEHLEHILPAQAPIQNFVHHNTLHGYQHLHFTEALKQSHQTTGAYGYWTADQFRQLYQQGRINDDDIKVALNQSDDIETTEILIDLPENTLTRGDILRTAMVTPIKSITPGQYIWQVEEVSALEKCQPDLSDTTKATLLNRSKAQGLNSEPEAINQLWLACLKALQIEHFSSHPEELLSFTPERAARMFAAQLNIDAPNIGQQVKQQSTQQLEALCSQVGKTLTMRGLLRAILGDDILGDIRPMLIRPLAEWLDQGVSAWTEPDSKGFYAHWKETVHHDLSRVLSQLPDWDEHLDSLPDNPLEAIIAELRRMDIPEHLWESYLERLALELPGWSGMFLWRHQHPGYEGIERKIHMLDYLAVRLTLEHLYARRLCREKWLLDANLGEIRGRFRRHHSEFIVRYYTYRRQMPEYLLNLSQQIISRSRPGVYEDHDWRRLAHLIWTWVKYPSNNPDNIYLAHNHGWRLFRLAQHLGLDAHSIGKLSPDNVQSIFACLDSLNDQERTGFLWLQAYEHHYREQLFNAIKHNHGRGTWQQRGETGHDRPDAQIIFCMDDREEGFRRHLEELNPAIETLGAAAFFNVPMNWQGLDDNNGIKLCPVPVTPVHLVKEVANDESAHLKKRHDKKLALRKRIFNTLHQSTRHSVLKGGVISLASAPVALGVMLGKSFAPRAFGQWVKHKTQQFDVNVPTHIEFCAENKHSERCADDNQLGFTDEEQADIVATFLKTNGLTQGFGAFVVLMGHYSSNQNNPHLSAYGCGACSGRYSGPNARAFSAMANRPEVRELIAKQHNISIPQDCWFTGAEHDTCNENITWTDLNQIPQSLQTQFDTLNQQLKMACQHSAHERCRKLASAPKNPSLKQALKHMLGRSMDYSQARPELGHATNASAFIGRRSLSRGTFLDRRTFLISYDYSIDPTGEILERILLSAGPVGAGISLEYYFSCVNNKEYGSGTKTTHNLVGLLGVMEGASSDLRTGLPRQMVEIHEPMRLQIVLEAKVDIVTQIYLRQPPLQELIGNGWILVSVKDPDSGDIHVFNPDKGFTVWKGKQHDLPTVKHSADWYNGHYDHLPPALIAASVPEPVLPDQSPSMVNHAAKEAHHA